MPEMFTPGTRVIENPDFHPLSMSRSVTPAGDTSVNPFTGEEPATGFMVAIDGENLHSLRKLIFRTSSPVIMTFSLVRMCIWVPSHLKITGKKGIELSRRVESFEEAKGLGKAFDQEGIFHLMEASMVTTRLVVSTA